MTTPEQSEGDRSRDELLAGEYVLGVLSLADRKRVEARIARDRTFAAIVLRWQENLSTFDDEYEDEMPPQRVYAGIETRLFSAKPSPRRTFAQELRTTGGWWNSLALWRGMSFASLALLITYASLQSGWIGANGPPRSPLVAEMTGENTSMVLMARYEPGSGRLHLTPVAARGEAERSLELWMVPGGNDPAISLGVLPQTGEGAVVIPAEMRERMGEGMTLAVSLEPFGGSPSGQPTGAVLAVGKTRIP